MSSTIPRCNEDIPSMLIFGVHEGERVAIDVPIGSTVGEVKKQIQIKLNIYFDDLVKQDKKILRMSYAGSDLGDHWIFTDLGIVPGSTVKVAMKEEVKPVLFVKCSHSGELIEIMDDYNVEKMMVDDLRTIISKKAGLPVSIFRIVSRDGYELYDRHCLFDYNVECGHTVYMENWDGWTELINYSILGLTPSVMPLLVQDEIQSRFQLKVAMYISAHYGCVDLARTCIRLGVRPDEPIGEHPTRQWCHEQSHIETKRTSVHEAAEFGQLGVLRLFVNTDITCSMARDGHNLTPLNLSLRKAQKGCASFLLTKQWVRVPVTRSQSMTLQTFRRIKLWCERCKERAFMKFGPNKSSLKRRSFNTGPLVSHGVIVDGFSSSPMNGKSKQMQSVRERKKQANENNNNNSMTDSEGDPESYFKHLSAVTTYGPKFRQNTKWGKMVGRSSVGAMLGTGLKNILKGGDKVDGNEGTDSPDLESREIVQANNPQTNGRESIKLPPILEKTKMSSILSQSQPSVVQINPEEQHEKMETSEKLSIVVEKGRKYIRTGPTASKATLSNSMPNMKVRTNSTSEGKEKEKDRASVTSARSDKTVERATTAMSKVSKKRKKVTSAMLVQQGNKSTAEGTVPLPVISSEPDLRPFFYHNGVREDDLVIPLMNMVSNYQGTDARDRAVKSLAIANTFKEKPWLMQVRMAMSLTSSTLRREVTNLRHSFNDVNRHDRRISRSTNVTG